jgi:hypothetical protein
MATLDARVRYGASFAAALMLVGIAFVFFEPGPLRWFVLGLAAFEAVVTPRLMKLGS